MQKLSSILLTTLVGISIVALTHESRAQPRPAPSTADTRLITLGTVAGPPPRAHRAQSSNLLIVNGTLYVVDAGDGVARRIAKAGFDVREVGTVFITHHHDDHTAGLGTLMSVAWDNQRTKPINVYGPPQLKTWSRPQCSISALVLRSGLPTAAVRIPISQLFFGHDVGTGVIYQDANVKVTAIENSHFDFHKGPASGKHKSYSYRFDTPGRVIVFTGDTGPSDALAALAGGADLLVSEANSVEDRMQLLIKSGQWQLMTPEEQVRIKQQMAEGHLSPDAIGKMAARAGVKTVVLTHLTSKPDDDYTLWADEVKKHFSGQVFVAKDLMGF